MTGRPAPPITEATPRPAAVVPASRPEVGRGPGV